MGMTQLVSFPTRHQAMFDLVFRKNPDFVLNLQCRSGIGNSDHNSVPFELDCSRVPQSLPRVFHKADSVDLQKTIECNSMESIYRY